MENKQSLISELSKFEKNFKYMTESGLLYPNIDLKRRKRLVQIYNEIFDKKERISTTCRSCMKKYVKELAEWYKNETIVSETPINTELQSVVNVGEENTEDKPKKRGRKPKQEEYAEN